MCKSKYFLSQISIILLVVLGLFFNVFLIKDNAFASSSNVVVKEFSLARIYHIRGTTMGTFYDIKISAYHELNIEKIKKIIDIKLNKFNQVFSTWSATSLISRFNDYNSTNWFKVTDYFISLIKLSKRVYQLTDGGFDITLEPVIKLWGFDRGGIKRVPTIKQITVIKQFVGIDKIEISQSKLSIRKTNPKTQINLSGVAKGGGVDLIKNLLEKYGLHSFLINIGGEIYVKGDKYKAKHWVIAIDNPNRIIDTLPILFKGKKVKQILLLIKDRGLATSGDYRNYFKEHAQYFAHILNPSTGKPIKTRIASMSIIAKNTAKADALATGMSVLSAKKIMMLAKKESLALLFLLRRKHSFLLEISPQMTKYVKIIY